MERQGSALKAAPASLDPVVERGVLLGHRVFDVGDMIALDSPNGRGAAWTDHWFTRPNARHNSEMHALPDMHDVQAYSRHEP